MQGHTKKTKPRKGYQLEEGLHLLKIVPTEYLQDFKIEASKPRKM